MPQTIEIEALKTAIAKSSASLQTPAPTPSPVVTTLWNPTHSLILSIATLVFGVLIIVAMTYLYYIRRNPESMLRSFSIPLIIVSAVFLVVAGFGEKQIAPVIGLLGTIAGYLLGRDPQQTVPRGQETGEKKDIEQPLKEGE